ncbi:hypothetical protein HR45_07200 [Shewanella mangrovi]|uniref:PilY1 beta-propeller domain-containing protein n=1 Tax=Shewanella mangrovi TaxID=1515746 RepID=A0A094K0S6_9GAMM|nr:PilC/PilY family type IV pilus protein [Shewanella mangrovi]KFZ38266.1 hypothetical protein HR45_07200 [Shewanella mangrovi]
MKLKKLLCTLLFTFVGLVGESWADDTDLYLLAPVNNGRAKVLIIFDNSASMSTVEESKSGYNDDGGDPDYVAPEDSAHSYDDGSIYFTVGVGIDDSALATPLSPSDSRRFNTVINACTIAYEKLQQYGRFTGYIREYVSNGNGKGTWQPIKLNEGKDRNNPIDCWEDVDAWENSGDSTYLDNNKSRSYSLTTTDSAGNTTTTTVDASTGYEPGIPVNDSAIWNSNTDNDYSAMADDFKSGELVTLYTANYLRWYYTNQPKMVEQSRLATAKSAIESVINTTETVDFGLEVFNLNYPDATDKTEEVRNGGRIVAGIKQRTESEKTALLNTINSLPAQTNTPLCETLYEAYRYFSGQSIVFGHQDKNYDSGDIKYTANKPPYDTSIEINSNTQYQTPFSSCSDVAYIIYITDGEPTQDSAADADVQALISSRSNDTLDGGSTTDGGNYESYTFTSDIDGSTKSSWLPALASYMYWHDQVPGSDAFQHVRTYTIGFSLDEGSAAEPLLQETANRGGGKYYSASSTASDGASSLVAAFSAVLSNITQEGQRFSAPGVAYSNADPTRTLDSAYYALFEPSAGPRWAGNLKKFKVNSSGTLVDANGDNAIGASGGIKDTACSYWSDCSSGPDGNDVQQGGAARSLVPDDRTIYTDSGSGGSFETLDALFSGASATDVMTYLNVTTADDLAKALSWLKGNNVDTDTDGTTLMSDDFDGVRGDIMGDPMHSQPLAIDYGGSIGTYIFMGTNEGMFHAFKDEGSSVTESWALMPEQFLQHVPTLRENSYSNGHSVYGIDGSPVSYLERNSDGSIKTAWLFLGLRRGGNDYFALDVTSPTSPKLKWHLTPSDTGFSELGESWSTPVVARIPTETGQKLAVIFGGGYDAAYDTGTPSSPVGRNVYIVDADDGTLIYNFGEGGSTSLPGIEDSIPGSIATLDSNGDGIVDRLYAADLGGNIWRMDMPSGTTSTWSAFKFAFLGGALTSNRHFFYEPVVAQTEFSNVTTVTYTDASGNTTTTTGYQNVPYDAVTLGSGNRAAPLDTSVQDMFFVLQDRHVVTKTFSSDIIPDALTLSNLYDVTSSAPSSDDENIAFGTKLGWFYSFPGTGEKSLSPSTIIKGKVYFTSFTPSLENPEETCQITSQGRLYTFDLHKGGRTSYEYRDICDNCIPQPPKIVTPPDDPDDPDAPDAVLIIGSGECVGDDCSGTVKLESGLTTNKIYYHVNED